MTLRSGAGRPGSWLAVAASLLLACCGGAPGDAGTAALDAALVPEADIILRIEVAALREAAIFASPDSDEPAAAPHAEGSGDASPADAPGTGNDFDAGHFLEVTGLGPDDVVTVLASADLDEISIESEAADSSLDHVVAVAGLRLSRALDLDTLEKALRESVRGDATPTITRIDLAGTPALRIDPADPEESDAFVASLGDTLLATPNEASLVGALARVKSGETGGPSADLQRLYAALPEDAQGRFAFAVSQKVRDGIAAKLEAPSPGTAMVAGFARPFKDIRSLSFTFAAAAELTAVLAADLGAAEAAEQARAILGGMLAPMAKAALADALGRPAGEVEDRLQVTSAGQTFEIRLRLDADDVAGYRSKQAGKAAGAE